MSLIEREVSKLGKLDIRRDSFLGIQSHMQLTWKIFQSIYVLLFFKN